MNLVRKAIRPRKKSTQENVVYLQEFLIAQEIEEMAYPSFLEIYQRYKLMSSKKLHITDLTPNQQDKLRKEIYGVIRELKLPCFWNAIHVEGFSALDFVENSIFTRFSGFHFSIISTSCKRPL